MDRLDGVEVLTAKQITSRTRGRRSTRIGAAIGLSAVVGGAWLVGTGSAQADEPPLVEITVEAPGGWAAGWGKAWDACQDLHPQTKSVEMIFNQPVAVPGGASFYHQKWVCRDTP
jgi:hypothetical protein